MFYETQHLSHKAHPESNPIKYIVKLQKYLIELFMCGQVYDMRYLFSLGYIKKVFVVFTHG